jgi:hypothetical protein
MPWLGTYGSKLLGWNITDKSEPQTIRIRHLTPMEAAPPNVAEVLRQYERGTALGEKGKRESVVSPGE